ncbi:hypothetical protein SB8_01230 [Pseudomonas oryzihabitans]|nr:hypothetical protein SB8_01230 [Pseudomonas psychrotolerans]
MSLVLRMLQSEWKSYQTLLKALLLVWITLSGLRTLNVLKVSLLMLFEIVSLLKKNYTKP